MEVINLSCIFDEYMRSKLKANVTMAESTYINIIKRVVILAGNTYIAPNYSLLDAGFRFFVLRSRPEAIPR